MIESDEVCWWRTCDRTIYTIKSGLCSIHYDRAKRGIDMDMPVRGSGARRGVDPCSIDGCTRKAFSGPTGLCAMHFTRYRKSGDTGQPDPIPTGSSTRWHVDKFGYVRRRRDGKWETQHRQVMEAKLSRPLKAHENVHHINGIRHDNRPENLELWVKAQPAGQRVDDLVAWVVAEYPELVQAALDGRPQLRLVI